MPGNRDEVTSVIKAYQIIELFYDHEELGVTQIASMLKMPKGSVYRFLNTLKNLRMLEQNNDNGRYRPSIGLVELSNLYLGRLDWHQAIRPYLIRLSEETEEIVYLAVRDKTNIIYIDKLEGKQTMHMSSQVGLRRPAHCTGTGKALLSGLSDEELKMLYDGKKLKKFTEHTIVTLDHLLVEMVEIRKKGYAFDDGEMELGVGSIASNIKGVKGEVLASIGVCGPTIRIKEIKFEKIISSLLHTVNEASIKLGYK